MKDKNEKEGSLLKNSISGLQFGILQQLVSRVLTFILNVLIVRAVSAELIGVIQKKKKKTKKKKN